MIGSRYVDVTTYGRLAYRFFYEYGPRRARGQGLPYLALAVADESELGATAGLLTVEPRIASAIQRELGTTALLYRRVNSSDLSYLGLARLAALRAPSADSRQCELEALRWFSNPVPGAGEGAAPGARRSISLSAERFAEVLDAAGVSSLGGLSEATDVALAGGTQPEDYLRLNNEVMRRWGYRCAVTDVQFAAISGLHPQLRLVAIRPRALGGPLDVRNFLPMVEIAEHAWVTGAISVAPAFDIVAVLNRLPAELLEAMSPDGKLIVPENRDEWPDAGCLAFHRTRIFAGRS